MPYKDPNKRKAYGQAYRNTPANYAKNQDYQREYRHLNRVKLSADAKRRVQEHPEETRLYQANYRANHKDETRTYNHQHYRDHKDERLARQRAYDSEHPEARATRNAKHHELNREHDLAYLRIYGPDHQLEIKSSILTYYGNGVLACVRCGFDDDRALTIDHVRGEGNKHRKDNNITHFYHWLINENLPGDFRTLCGCCQHEVMYDGHDTYAPSYLKLKLAVFGHYSHGNIECAQCGHPSLRGLTLDHIKGNGNEHRRQEHIKSGVQTYRWLRDNGFPEGFQVLCYNCNIIKKIEEREYGYRISGRKQENK